MIPEEIVITLCLVALVVGLVAGFVVGKKKGKEEARRVVRRYLDDIVRNVEAAREHLDNVVEDAAKLERELGEKEPIRVKEKPP